MTNNNIIVRNVADEVKMNKLNYSYSINLYRSFPNLLDGMKVVNRRILYSAHKMHLDYNKPHKKSVALIGTSILFHCHGDSSIYDAMAKMTQNFYQTCPYLDGQGSWGTPSGDAPSSMRYCVTGDTMVVTDTGLKRIDSILETLPNTDNDISIKVPSIYNKENTSSKLFNCGKHEVRTVETELGYKITGTNNHPLMVLTYKDNKLRLDWKLIEDIVEGDYIVFNGGRYNNTNDVISIEEARVLGSLVSKAKRYGEYNKDMLTEEEYKVYIDKYGIKFGVGREIPKEVLESSASVQREFIRYLFEEKSKPVRIINESKGFVFYDSVSKTLLEQLQQVLLNTFNILSSIIVYRHESNTDKTRVYRLTIQSRENIKKFHDVINFVGGEKKAKLNQLVTYIKERELRYNKTKCGLFIENLHEYIHANKTSDKIFLKTARKIHNKDKLIQYYAGLKETLSKEDFKVIDDIVNNDFYFLKVKNISDPFEDTVYSIRVDSECHSFIANGMINHNTETRLSKYGHDMLENLNKNTVNWVESALGDDKEPITLPVKYPNILINGSYGIGQGYNCFIPPHNFNEVMDITIDLIKDPTIDQETIIERLAPDFPLGGVIINSEELKDVYRKGYGVCKVRGEVQKDEKNNSLIIKSFPHIRTNLNSIKDTIGEKVRDGFLQGISDIKDLTKKNDINLIIKAKRGYSLDKLEQELYKLTPLQSTLSLSFMCTENDKTFRHYAIKEIFIKWIDYRKLTIKRYLNFDMSAMHKRLHIIEALLKALIDIDEVISIIKKSADKQESIQNLMAAKKFDFNILQARYIVDLPLSQLSRIGKESLLKEQAELEEKLQDLIELFSDDKKLSDFIIRELKEGKKKYGRPRLTKVTNIDADGAEVLDKDYTIFLTKEGFIKKLELELNTQSSGTKGRKCGKLRKNDYIISALNSHNTDTLLFVTNKGNSYGVKVHEVDEVGLSTLGITVDSLINLKEDEKVINVINVSNSDFSNNENFLLFVTEKGMIKKSKLTHYEKVNKNSLIAIKLNPEDNVREILIVTDNDEVLVATNNGRYSRYGVSEVSESLRMTMGVQVMSGLSVSDTIVGASKLTDEKEYVVVIDQKGLAKRINKEAVIHSSRTNKGKLLTKTDSYVARVKEANNEDELTIVTKEKILKIKVESVKESIRTSKGKPCINLEGEDTVLDIIVE